MAWVSNFTSGLFGIVWLIVAILLSSSAWRDYVSSKRPWIQDVCTIESARDDRCRPSASLVMSPNPTYRVLVSVYANYSSLEGSNVDFSTVTFVAAPCTLSQAQAQEEAETYVPGETIECFVSPVDRREVSLAPNRSRSIELTRLFFSAFVPTVLALVALIFIGFVGVRIYYQSRVLRMAANSRGDAENPLRNGTDPDDPDNPSTRGAVNDRSPNRVPQTTRERLLAVLFGDLDENTHNYGPTTAWGPSYPFAHPSAGMGGMLAGEAIFGPDGRRRRGNRVLSVAEAEAAVKSMSISYAEMEHMLGADAIGDDDGPVCVICLDPIEDNVSGRRGDQPNATDVEAVVHSEPAHSHDIVRLPCNHFFHRQCIMQWLTKGQAHCPCCNFDVASFVRGRDTHTPLGTGEALVNDDGSVSEPSAENRASARPTAARNARRRTLVEVVNSARGGAGNTDRADATRPTVPPVAAMPVFVDAPVVPPNAGVQPSPSSVPENGA